MIKITVNYSNNLVSEIVIDGHSNYEVSGKDIVCASVSSIAITTINAIIRIDDKALAYQEKDGYLNLKILKHSNYIDTLILNMLDLFKDLEKQYKKYIKIK